MVILCKGVFIKIRSVRHDAFLCHSHSNRFNIVKYATKLTEASVLQFSENYRILLVFMYNGISDNLKIYVLG